jgi:hypothetical protein
VLFLEGVGGGNAFVFGGDVAAHVEALHLGGLGAVRRSAGVVVWVFVYVVEVFDEVVGCGGGKLVFMS